VRRRLALAVASSLVLAGAGACSSGAGAPVRVAAARAAPLAPPPASAAPIAPPAAPSATAPEPPAPAPRLAFLEDDVPGAMARARAEGKAVFVDAWAPWCHTCLSVRAEVLSDPSLAPLAERAVFVAVDTDRPENAPFLARNSISVWPTFFVLDPASERVVGYWPGSASAAELRGLVEEGVAAMAAGREGSLDDLTAARGAHARRDFARAASLYEGAVRALDAGSPRRSEALVGWIHALRAARAWDACARVGREHVGEVAGAAMPADFAGYLLECAEKLPPGATRDAARAAAVARLRSLASAPPADASPDDRADVLGMLAEALGDAGDAAGARRANEERLGVLERAAATAGTPERAATYDYARAMTYLALGRADDAVRMLEARERERPDGYETPARLADVLAAAGRPREALAAIERAIGRAYGPRRLRYLERRARLQAKLGDRAGQIATLREEVRGWEALARGQANADRLAGARRRLAAALSGTSTADD
jgi:tetratricopeptide (TPR) repeat protein